MRTQADTLCKFGDEVRTSTFDAPNCWASLRQRQPTKCPTYGMQATAQGLVSVPGGAFDDQRIADVVKLAKNKSPMYLVPVGYTGGIIHIL